MVPRRSQDDPKMAPRWPQGGVKLTRDGPGPAEIAARWPKIAPRWPQYNPRWPQAGPRWPRTNPKTALDFDGHLASGCFQGSLLTCWHGGPTNPASPRAIRLW